MAGPLEIPACLHCMPPQQDEWMKRGALDDPEGLKLPSSLPPVVDAHVHLFPDRMFEAIWRWFDSHAWPVRYKLNAPRVTDFLFTRGVEQIVALHYAHKAGIAASMNAFMRELCQQDERIIGLATVFPGEPGAKAILADAFDGGLRGIKLHCHVQAIAADAPAVRDIYQVADEHGKPVVIHAGREPNSPHYPVNTYEICSADRVEQVLKDHPELKLCVPHLGADEYAAYERLLDRYDNLWLDTTMTLAEYFPGPSPIRLLHARPDRILYGTDFPNLPFAWDREIKKLVEFGLAPDALSAILAGNALKLFAPSDSAARPNTNSPQT